MSTVHVSDRTAVSEGAGVSYRAMTPPWLKVSSVSPFTAVPGQPTGALPCIIRHSIKLVPSARSTS